MIAVRVDSHKARHYAVGLDHLGQMLAELTFPATAVGYAELQQWAELLAQGRELVFGIEGAGSWGAGLCEHLAARPAHRPRGRASASTGRRSGKSDRIDAIAAAKRVLADKSVSTPRRRGILTAIRALLIARRSAVDERTRVLNQLQALTATAPIGLRERVGSGTGKQLERRILSLRSRPNADLDERIAFTACGTSPRTRAPSAKTPSATRTNSPSSSARSTRPCSTNPESARSLPPSCSPATPSASRARPRSPAATALHDPCLIRQDSPLPAQPRRRPPGKQRDPHHRDQVRQAPTRNPRLPRTPPPGRQDQTRGAPIAQAPHLARALPPPHRRPLDFIEASVTPGILTRIGMSKLGRLDLDPEDGAGRPSRTRAGTPASPHLVRAPTCSRPTTECRANSRKSPYPRGFPERWTIQPAGDS
jgi:Transposase